MDFDFLKEGLVAPKPVGREKKDKQPMQPIWDRYLEVSRDTIAKSIVEWHGYINKPEDRAAKYYAAKNWTIVNKEQFARGNSAEVSCSMTVGKITKFKVIPKYVWDGKGANKTPVVDQSSKVGAVTQRQDMVAATLQQFQSILASLNKESDEGMIFWRQARAIAKPKSKRNWVYNAEQDLWLDAK